MVHSNNDFSFPEHYKFFNQNSAPALQFTFSNPIAISFVQYIKITFFYNNCIINMLAINVSRLLGKSFKTYVFCLFLVEKLKSFGDAVFYKHRHIGWSFAYSDYNFNVFFYPKINIFQI